MRINYKSYFLRHMRSPSGYTLVEVIISATILTIISLGIVSLFYTTEQGITQSEATVLLAQTSQEIVSRTEQSLFQAKRLFHNTVEDNAFLARVQLTSPAMAGSRLPYISASGVLSPNDASFDNTNVGNSLFFAVGSAPTVYSSTPSRVDIYNFHYFYLSLDSSKKIAGQPIRQIWHWKSGQYADYSQLMLMSTTTRAASVDNLIANGKDFAWDPSSTNVANAFYELQTGGSINPLPAHLIAKKEATNLLTLQMVSFTGGFRFSVSPNTGGGFQTRDPVPQFANVSGDFPSGFETAVVGGVRGRQVFIRLVLVAQGAFKGYVSKASSVIATSRDIY